MWSGEIVLVQWHETCSTDFFHDATSYIRTSDFKGKRKRESTYCCIDIQGRFKQNLSLNCTSLM